MLKVQAFQIAESIDIRSFRDQFTAEIMHADKDELFYHIQGFQYLYVFKYGVVCLCQYNQTESTAFLQLMAEYCRNPLAERLSDEFEIDPNAGRYKLGYNKLELSSADPDMIRLVMLHLSQSVALDYYSHQSNRLLEETNRHTQRLEVEGKLHMGGTNLKKYIGRTLNLKNRISENLYIFDSPEETWENEDLNRLDQGLKRTFDLQVRFRTIQDSLGIVKENLELFKDLLQSRNSTMLEWIIIILILVEVVNLFVEKIFT
jgi:uncharacterized Rmd1/YagE family protein